MLRGIQSVLGFAVAINGGSSGDNAGNITGYQFARGKLMTNSIVLNMFWTSAKVYTMFENGFVVSCKHGVITKAEGRRVYEIDNQPCIEVLFLLLLSRGKAPAPPHHHHCKETLAG